MNNHTSPNRALNGNKIDMEYKFIKNNPDDMIWWVDNPDVKGEHLFSFDKQNVFNLFSDYPHKLTKRQKELFDKENPFWRDFFRK